MFQKQVVIHELGHALGLYHEQSRPDRDDYIRINLNNVDAKHHHNFVKFPTTLLDTQGVAYDYKSIMHYGETVS